MGDTPRIFLQESNVMQIQRHPSVEELGDIFMLDAVKGFGPQKFKDLHKNGISASSVLKNPQLMERFGKRGLDYCKQIEAADGNSRPDAYARAERQLKAAREAAAAILTYDRSLYPRVLYDSNYPVPVLYARGDLGVLNKEKSVACVGSRKIRPPYEALHNAFASRAVSLGYTIVSGFATGADIIGHLAAEQAHGNTVGVLPSGLDRPFPPENKDIWHRFISNPGALFVSEFGFGVGANALNLRKRNKMIVGMASGLLISQSTEDGGAMNAFRFGVEQKKPIATFRSDGTSQTSGNDLIAGSAESVRSTVLDLNESDGWNRWLHTL